ncbi:MAG: twin-arginine translocation signal domain-containing protein, partial [Rhodospirillaceae bacterium]
MDRRGFLKSLAGAAAVAVVPVPAGAQSITAPVTIGPAVPVAGSFTTLYGVSVATLIRQQRAECN